MGLAGSEKCYDGGGGGGGRGGINAHVRLCLPDRAQAQHLLGCVWAKLCEGLEPKALTTHYSADKCNLWGKFPESHRSSPPALWLLALQICLLVKHSRASCRSTNMYAGSKQRLLTHLPPLLKLQMLAQCKLSSLPVPQFDLREPLRVWGHPVCPPMYMYNSCCTSSTEDNLLFV